MSEISRLLSIRQLVSTPYHPQSQGVTEKLNGTLKSMLKKMCAEKPNDWDRYIDALLFAYREVPQASLGFSPFDLLYGRSIRGPMAVLKELWSKEEKDPEVRTTYQYVVELSSRLQDTCQAAHENLVEASAKARQYYNRKAKARPLQVWGRGVLMLPTD